MIEQDAKKYHDGWLARMGPKNTMEILEGAPAGIRMSKLMHGVQNAAGAIGGMLGIGGSHPDAPPQAPPVAPPKGLQPMLSSVELKKAQEDIFGEMFNAPEPTSKLAAKRALTAAEKAQVKKQQLEKNLEEDKKAEADKRAEADKKVNKSGTLASLTKGGSSSSV